MNDGWAATIIVDASWCPETKAGGYGFWIASNRGKVGGGHALNGAIESSTLAEMQAVCNALFIAKNEGYVFPGDEVLVQTDCRAAIQGFEGYRTTEGAEAEARNTYLKLNQSIYVELRHVKGHSRSLLNRFRAQSRCDYNAYQAMLVARKLLKRAPAQ